VCGLKELVGVAAGAGVGGSGEHALGFGGVHGIVELGDRGGSVAQRWMRRDVGNPLAIDIHFAAVAQRLQELGAGEGSLLAFDDVFGVLGHGSVRCGSARAAR
jgi:hypothetical protein